MASPSAVVGVARCARQQQCLVWCFSPLTQQWPGLLCSMQVCALVDVAVWKEGGLQGVASPKPGWSCVTVRCGWMLMYRSEVVRWQFGGCFSLALLWCQRVSAVGIVHTLWALDVCPHVSRQLFSTVVLMESLGPRASFNVCLTTFHILLPNRSCCNSI